MTGKIRVLIADDITATRDNICKLVEFHPEITIAGQAATAEEAIVRAKEIRPDIILMDINMPGMDGIAATEIISAEVPTASIIIMSVQSDQEYLRRAMIAGAKNYLTKPFTGDELLQAVKRVYANEQKRQKVVKLEPQIPELGKIITIFSSKGGVGKTTLATNLAVALSKSGAKIGLVDADLQFGDVALFLNVVPKATIADLVQDIEHMDEALLESYMAAYSSNVKVLPAPLRPEQADMVTGAHLVAILKTMRRMFQYVIVDTAPTFNDAILSVLDVSDQVLVVSSMDLPTVKNVKLCLEIMESLNYGDNKIKVVLNRADSDGGMEVDEVAESLRYSFFATVPSDGKIVVTSVNKGVPFVVSNPDAKVSHSLFNLAKIINGSECQQQEESKGVMHRLKALFG